MTVPVCAGSAGPARQASRSGIPECSVSLAGLWLQLEQGDVVVVEHFFSAERCYCVVRRSDAEGVGRGLGAEQRDFLRRLVIGEQQKAIAFDLGISCTAVTLRAQRCVRRIGLSCRVSALPLFVLLSGLAFHGQCRTVTEARLSYRYSDGEYLRVYSCLRIDTRLPTILSQAEQEVTRSLVEGHSSAAIARMRGTAARTAANQIGSVFAKLGVSGRLQLIRALAVAPWPDHAASGGGSGGDAQTSASRQ